MTAALTIPTSDLRELVAGVDREVARVARVEQRVSVGSRPGYQPPRFPHERLVEGPGGRLRVSQFLLWTDGPRFRQEFPDGVPVRICDGHTVWSFYHWPDDTFRVAGDPELTAVRREIDGETRRRRPIPGVGKFTAEPPAGLLEGTDPPSPAKACSHRGTAGWRFDLPDLRDAVPGCLTFTTYIVSADTGLVLHTEGPVVVTPEQQVKVGYPSQTDWFDHQLLTPPVDPSVFTWTGPERPLTYFAA